MECWELFSLIFPWLTFLIASTCLCHCIPSLFIDLNRMDKRGIPIVLCSSNYSLPRRPYHHSLPHGLHSPYIFQNVPSEVTLLEAYDSFADACFQSHFKFIEKNKKHTFNLDKLYKQSMVSLESVTSTLKSEKPRKRKRQFNPEDDIPTTTHPEVLKRDKKEINNITKSFPKLTSYYRLIGRAGRGTFSKVYKARDLFYDRYKPFKRCCEIKGLKEHYVAIKVMYDISSPQRIANEITFLSKLRSSSCVIPLITAFRNKSTSYLIFPYIEYDNFEDIYTKMTLVDIKYYLVNLFTALKNIHAKGIIHRDVKPGNFLFSLKNRKGFLTDFGLAEKMSNYDDIEQRIPEDAEMIAEKYSSSQGERPGIFKNDSRKSIHVNRSGTKGFRAPEVMMRYEYQTGAMDIWAAGIILLSFLSGCYPLFDANDDADIMLELAHIYGLKKLTECGEYYGRRFRVNIPTVSELPIPFEEICRCMNKSRVDGWDKNEFMEAIDLTKSCLQLIHSERITASKALEHPFLINISILDY